MSITPDKLRASYAAYERDPKTTTWAPVMSSDCAMLADAMEIADSCARADIENNCPGRRGDSALSVIWYDIRYFRPKWIDGEPVELHKAEPEDRSLIEQAVRYLDARRTLLRMDGSPHLVSFKDPQ